MRIVALALSVLGACALGLFGLFGSGLECADVRPADVSGCEARALLPFVAAALLTVAAGVIAFTKRRGMKVVSALGGLLTVFGIFVLASLLYPYWPR